MRKDCDTCKHDEFGERYCDDCLAGRNGNPPTKWEAADFYEPDTNAQHIRNMSDEELVEYIECPYDAELCVKKKDCYGCILEWLKQPCE